MTLPQPAARGEAVDDGHHHVEHDGVRHADVDGLEGLGAVADRLDVVALEAQHPHEGLPQPLVVLGHQDVVLGAVVAHRTDPTVCGQDGRKNAALTRFLRHCAPTLTGSDNHRVVRLRRRGVRREGESTHEEAARIGGHRPGGAHRRRGSRPGPHRRERRSGGTDAHPRRPPTRRLRPAARTARAATEQPAPARTRPPACRRSWLRSSRRAPSPRRRPTRSSPPSRRPGRPTARTAGSAAGPGGPGKGFGLDEAAAALGMTTDELRTALAGGQSIADVAKAKGVDLAKVTDALVAAYTKHEQDEVTAGSETQAEADKEIAAFKDQGRRDRERDVQGPPRRGAGPDDHHAVAWRPSCPRPVHAGPGRPPWRPTSWPRSSWRGCASSACGSATAA